MPKNLSLDQLRRSVRRAFLQDGIEAVDLETRLLIEHVFGLTHSEQIVAADNPVSLADKNKVHHLLDRRLSGEPLDYILGYREFYGLRFEINEHVLSPRPETEMLVDYILGNTDKNQVFNFVDLGTGSGAIAISILCHRPNARAIAVDVSEKALLMAKKNAEGLGVGCRIEFFQSDWGGSISGRFDYVVSNPPYIDDKAMRELSSEVSHFDPKLALFGGEDGLEAYRVIIDQSRMLLKSGGKLIFEIGFDQGTSVPELLAQKGYEQITVEQDLAGHDRLVAAIATN